MDKRNKTVFSKLFVMPKQGRAVKFYQPENKMGCTQREKFFCSGVDWKSSGVGCSRVEIPCSGAEIGG